MQPIALDTSLTHYGEKELDATGTTTYTYSNGLLQSENGPWNGDTVSYAYNTARQRNELVILQPTGNAWTNTYAWDAARRLSGVTSPPGTHTYLYDTPGSRVRSITLPGGLYLTNDSDSLSRVANMLTHYLAPGPSRPFKGSLARGKKRWLRDSGSRTASVWRWRPGRPECLSSQKIQLDLVAFKGANRPS